MAKPKGVALAQAGRPGRPVAEYEEAYLGERLGDRAGPLKLYWRDGICMAALNRPESLNALGDDLLDRLDALIGEVERGKAIRGRRVEALLLCGSGRAFMAGADVTGFVGKTDGEIAALASRVIGVFGRLENLPLPVVSVIDGFALGGGNELAMSAHYRIVTENARIGQPEVKLGIIPGYGGMQRLPRLVGPRRAAALALNGEPVDGHAALGMGLADAFCPAATALRVAFHTAQELARGTRTLARRNWDAIAHGQRAELDALFAEPTVADLLAAPAPTPEQRSDLPAARRFAARIALEAMRTGYEAGYTAGLANDARLFGMVTAAPGGQEWVRRFLAKDPRQSAFLTLLP
jgi:enoyl-CoA hydratase